MIPKIGFAERLLSIAKISYSSSNLYISLLSSFSLLLCFLLPLQLEKIPRLSSKLSKDALQSSTFYINSSTRFLNITFLYAISRADLGLGL